MTRAELESVAMRKSIIDAFHADEPDAADIQRAYVRFSWARRRASGGRRLFRWVVAGAALGVAAASAATFVPKISMTSGKNAAPVTVHGAANAGARSPRARGSEVATLKPSTRPAQSASELSELQVGAITVSPMQAPKASTTEANPFGSMANSDAVDSDWRRAARALRTGDLSAADQALERLENSEDPRQRDAASLARAQLLVSQGRGSEVRSTLERLSRDAHSELIRSQSAAILAKLRE